MTRTSTTARHIRCATTIRCSAISRRSAGCRTGRAAIGIDDLSVDDRVFDPAGRHDHALGAARQIEAALAAARRADAFRIEDRDIGSIAEEEAAAAFDAE